MEQNGLISTDQAVNPNVQGEQTLDDPTGNDEMTQDLSVTCQRKELLKDGATSFAKFLYWTHVLGLILLSAGFFAPGWLTVKTRQAIYEEDGTLLSRMLVFQDYSLWYITQCTFSSDVMDCDTMTYRIIDAALEGDCGNCHKLKLNSYETESFMVFSGAGLVFSYTELVSSQVMYTLGILIAVYVFRELYSFRKNIREDRDVNMTTKSWLILLTLESLCACFVLYPTFMFFVMDINLKLGVQTPLGSVLAALGGSLVTIVIITIFLQIVCCMKSKGIYICYSEMENDKNDPEEEENEYSA